MRTWRPLSRRMRAFAVGLLVLSLLVAAGALVLFLQSRAAGAPLWGTFLVAVAMVGTSAGIAISLRMRTSATGEWVEMHNGLWARRMPWAEVAEILSAPPADHVQIRPTGGKDVGLPGLTRADAAELTSIRDHGTR